MPKQATSSKEVPASSSQVKTLEMNTEQCGQGEFSTYGITSRLIQKGNPYAFKTVPQLENEGVPVVRIRPEEAWNILTKMKDHARNVSNHIAGVVKKIAQKGIEHTNTWRQSISRQIVETLDATGIRRMDATLSEEHKKERTSKLRRSILKGDPKLAIIAFPSKFENPTKTSGPLPDIGEAAVLIQLWMIGRTCDLARQSEAHLLEPVMDELFPEVAKDDRKVRLHAIFQENPADENARRPDMEDYKRRMLLETAGKKEKRDFFRGADALKDYASEISVTKPNKFYQLLRVCLKQKIHPSALMEYMALDDKPIQLNSIRHEDRYPCYARSQTHEDLQNYGEGLQEIIKGLNLGDHLNFVSRESQLNKLPTHVRDQFYHDQDALYEEFTKSYYSKIDMLQPSLMAAKNKDEFHHILQQGLPAHVSSMFEPIMFSMKYPEITAKTESSPDPVKAYLTELVGIYSPIPPLADGTMSPEEELRQRTIVATLRGAAQYVATYNSNSGANNHLGVDDALIAMGGEEINRLSIHKKDPASGQFSVSLGAGADHRAPWHSSAKVVLRNSTIEVKSMLASELKATECTPVLVEDNANASPWLRKLAKGTQPLFWAAKDSGIIGANGKLSEKLQTRPATTTVATR